MFIYYGCNTCGFACRVSKMDKELDLLSLRMRCPSVSCEGQIQLADDAKESDTKDFSAKDLFSAAMGRGLPEEKKCSPERLRELLIHGDIIELDVEESSADEDRSIINSMTITQRDAAYKVFFAMSTNGATIYKVQANP